jgi:SAM-dependent methyltransferase
MGDAHIPKRLGAYRKVDYWNQRYKEDTDTYDWLMNFEKLRPLIRPLIKESDRILILGCGNSTLSEQLYEDGFTRVVSIDYSKTVVEAMRKRAPHLEWLQMDMCKLEFPSESFEVVLDKGSLDAVFTDGGSVWNPSTQVRSDVGSCIHEVLRVLKPGGIFISISFGQPHFRKPYISCEGWTLNVEPIEDTFYFLYTAIKT